MARDETFTRAAQPGASPRPARVEAGLAGRNRGRGPKGTPKGDCVGNGISLNERNAPEFLLHKATHIG